MVQANDHAVTVHNERVSATKVGVVDRVPRNAVEVERDLLAGLLHTVHVELGLAGAVTAELPLVLLRLRRISRSRCVRVRLEVVRVVALGFYHVDLTVPWPWASCGAGEPEQCPRGWACGELDADLSAEVTPGRRI